MILTKIIHQLHLQQNQKTKNMHFAKYHSVAQIQNNVQIISGLMNKSPNNKKQTRQQSQSPPLHARTKSIVSPPHSFAFNLEPTIEQQEKSINTTTQYQRQPIKNPQSIKIHKFDIQQAKPVNKGFIGMKLRKASDNNIIYEREEIQEEQKDLFSSDNIKNFSRTPKNGIKLKERKSSCNLDFMAFMKNGRKNSQNNSGAEKKNRRQTGLIKKKSNGWDQNNNFQFSMNITDEAQTQQQTNITEIPKLQNLRKQSQNQSPKKAVPSFLSNSKNHRNSIDAMNLSKKGKLSIQNFIILKQLGKGTFGRVILGIQRQSKMTVAIKIMSKRQVQQTNMTQQLIRQLKIQMYVNHPNIAKVYGFFDDLLHFYIIMECALDVHLSQAIKRRVKNPTDIECATIMKQVCLAVACLHSQSIIHRDLKPENILFHQGVVKITDFGWSVRSDGRLRTTFCGTPVYLCPQILIGDQYDESVDIWTVGVILYEIYYRNNPFRIKCKQDLVNILKESIYFDQKIEICNEAKDFIQTCLKKRAAERSNIRELLLHPFLSKALEFQQIKR